MLILILLGKYKYLSKENWKENLLKIMIISVIPMAIFSNFIIYLGTTLNSNFIEGIKPIIGVTLTGLTIVGICGIKTKKELGKILLFTLVAFVLFFASEMITFMIVILGLHSDISKLNLTPFLNFVMFIPERLFQYGFLTYVVIKKNSLTQISLAKLVFKNKLLKNILIVVALGDLIIIFLFFRYIFVTNTLSILGFEGELFLVVTGLSLIIINVFALLLIAVSIYQKEKYNQRHGKGGDEDEE
jgi:hypothetical protein